MSKVIDLIHLMGPGWVAGRVLYALRLRSGWIRIRTPGHSWKNDAPTIFGRFFNERVDSENSSGDDENEAEAILKGRFRFFNRIDVQCGMPPNWFGNPCNGNASDEKLLKQRHWSRIPDFARGDIKCTWELSRFAWVFPLVRSYRETGQQVYAETCLKLIDDWMRHNPPNSGIHWKCGQEIAIRMFALVTAYFGFKQVDQRTNALIAEIIYESAQRIEANIGYALSQQNNHGVSEAAGLFTAGVLFGKEKWVAKGSGHLEKQIQALVSADGSFSQHSANYHRVMLHACLWAIQLGRANEFEFSESFTDQVRAAGKWLLWMYDPQTGRMPNFGANDGALILPFSVCDYLDYRPTIQAVGAVVDRERWIDPGPWDDLAAWLVPDLPAVEDSTGMAKDGNESSATPVNSKEPEQLKVLDTGGYAILANGRAKLVFRCPSQFIFRPAQCDLLHVDGWANGINILRDAGTYSYNCPQPWQDYFKGTAAHNTIQFDDHDQMPKISRFLYGKWPRLDVKYGDDSKSPYVEAGFTDWKGCFHRRLVAPTENGFMVTDTIGGIFQKAMLRWRLAPELNWKLDGDHCKAAGVEITVTGSSGSSTKLNEGWESLYYMEKTPIPVLETTVGPDCREIITHIRIGC